jgi:putative acetyltransferase
MSNLKKESSDSDVVIRAIEPEDYQAIKAIYEQPGAYSGTLQMPFPSAQMWKDRTSKPPPGFHVLVACVDEVPVGHFGLMVKTNPRQRHTGHIGMAVHDDYAGRGIGYSLMQAGLDIADNWLNLSRVELTVYVDNHRAVNLYRRTGFEEEGTLRNYSFRDGSYVDAFTMARLR